MKIGIVGYGHVGQAMHKLFKDAVLYDINGIGSKEEINKCNIVFVCVPTPSNIDGSCNTTIVEEVIKWVNVSLIILRSTVYIGFTNEMMNKYKKEIVFQPEYYGETAAHPFADLSDRSWLSFGGRQGSIDLAIKAYQMIINSNVRIFQSDASTVEFAKYMENSFLAMKVTFCNEMYDLASAFDLNYNLIREIWLADPRIGSSHTFVYEDNRGFGGSCLPKDLASIINQGSEKNINLELLKSIQNKNKLYKNK